MKAMVSWKGNSSGALLAVAMLGSARVSTAQGATPTTTATESATTTEGQSPPTTEPPPPTTQPSIPPTTTPVTTATPQTTTDPAVPPLLPPPSDASLRVKAALEQASKLAGESQKLRDKHTITEQQGRSFEQHVAAWSKVLGALGGQVTLVDQRREELTKKAAAAPPGPAADLAQDALLLQALDASLNNQLTEVESGLSGIEAQLEQASSARGWTLVGTILSARCATAICFNNGQKQNWLGIEPLVELPVGKSLSLSRSSLADYVDNHELRIDLAAGARVWFFRDLVSVSVYISKPLTDGRIRLEGSPFVYPASAIRRPYPGVALGLLFDSLWIGFDRDELRNGDGQDLQAVNPDFAPNSVVSSTWTMTVALQPVTAFRTAIGTAVQSTRKGP